MTEIFSLEEIATRLSKKYRIKLTPVQIHYNLKKCINSIFKRISYDYDNCFTCAIDISKILGMGSDELYDMLDDENQALIRCHALINHKRDADIIKKRGEEKSYDFDDFTG